MNSNCSNLQEQVKKAFCYQKLFWPFTVWINCSSDLNFFSNSRPSASNFKSFSRSLEQFFLTIGQNKFRNKIPFLQFIELFAIKCTVSWLVCRYVILHSILLYASMIHMIFSSVDFQNSHLKNPLSIQLWNKCWIWKLCKCVMQWFEDIMQAPY